MSLHGTVSSCIPMLLLALFLVNVSYFCLFGLMLSRSFPVPLLPLIVSTFALAWNLFSAIWLWQYWLRPDWSLWRIISAAAINFSLSLVEFYLVKWKRPQSEQIVLASLIVTGVNAALQMLLAICLSLLRPRFYEPLVRSRVTIPCLSQRSPLDPAQGAVADQAPSHSRNALQLESLYKTHQDSRKKHTEKFSKAFAPVNHLPYRPKPLVQARRRD